MSSASLRQFARPSVHEAVSTIIRRRSTNKTDVRLAAIEGLDLATAERILDLGCGFGFMSEMLARRASPNARVLGVDLWQENETPFRRHIDATGRKSDFICTDIRSGLPLPDRAFDIVASCYSLYFFVEALPEISRVVAQDGLFVAVTHKETNLAEVLRLAGWPQAGTGLESLARAFSAEHGASLLRRWFGEVERVDYRNSLLFEKGDVDELLTYLQFKIPFFDTNSESGDYLPDIQRDDVAWMLETQGRIAIRKDDAVFRCRQPLCR